MSELDVDNQLPSRILFGTILTSGSNIASTPLSKTASICWPFWTIAFNLKYGAAPTTFSCCKACVAVLDQSERWPSTASYSTCGMADNKVFLSSRSKPFINDKPIIKAATPIANPIRDARFIKRT